MSDDLINIDGEGLFGLIATRPMTFDPRIEARRREREAQEEREREDIRRRVDKLPTREELAVRAVDIFESGVMVDTKLKAMQFYAQLMGFMDKSGQSKKPAEEGQAAKTMAVPMAASDDEWQAIAHAYSKKLERIANA